MLRTSPTEDSAEKSTEADEVDAQADGDEPKLTTVSAGRDYVGQVTKQMARDLHPIGNEQQLRAIGSNSLYTAM